MPENNHTTETRLARRDQVLDRLERCRELLNECKTLKDAVKLAALSEAAKAYAKRVGVSKEVIAEASALRVEAERKLGQILEKTPKAKAGRPEKINRLPRLPISETDEIDKPETLKAAGKAGRPEKINRLPRLPISETDEIDKPETLKAAGISKHVSVRAQKLAAIPEEEFKAKIDETKEAGKNITFSTFIEREAAHPVLEWIRRGITLRKQYDSIEWQDEELIEVKSSSPQLRTWLLSMSIAAVPESQSQLRVRPPEGSKWSQKGWSYFLQAYKREPNEAEWEPYQKGRL
jgi:hypothetical protein